MIRETYIRFVDEVRHGDSHQDRGVFVASYALLGDTELPVDERTAIRFLLNWFSTHLTVPKNFEHPRAIFWFRSSAGETVRRVWELVLLLRRHDVEVRLVKTSKPGHIVYSDEHQVAAIPFADSFTRRPRRA